jgi:hypothetical protein
MERFTRQALLLELHTLLQELRTLILNIFLFNHLNIR